MVLDIREAAEPTIVNFKGMEIPVTYKPGNSSELLILFHGVIRRDVRAFPAYEKFLPVDCHQLSIADPALLKNERIISSWYLGGEQDNQVEIICELIDYVVNQLGIQRTLFLGGSAGGYAALLYSYKTPGSLAIAVSPQTRLSSYQSKFAGGFRTSMWPNANSFGDVANSDLVELYSQGAENFPIIVMSSRDTGHLHSQIFPFLGRLPFEMQNRLVLEVGFWNVLGHPSSVPRSRYLGWVEAALATADWSADNLSEIEFQLRGDSTVVSRKVKAEKRISFDENDLATAGLIRKFLQES